MKRFKSPLSAHYELTENCDNNCNHCYNKFKHNNSFVPKSTRNEILKEIVNSEIFHIIITGGEPLTDKLNLFYVIEKLKEENVKISLNTNLNLMDKETARILNKFKIESILTSVIHYDPLVHDTVTNNKGSLNSCLNGIRLVAEEGLKVSANMVVNKERLPYVYSTGKMLIEYGINGFCATRVAPNNNIQTLNPKETISMLDQLLQLQEDYGTPIASLNPIPRCFSTEEKYDIFMDRGCAGGLIGADITQFGYMKACQHQNYTLGNIINEGLKEVWQRIPILQKEVPDFCESCGECTGGCREIANSSEGEYGMDPLAIGNFEKKTKEFPKVKADTMLRFFRDIVHRKEDDGRGTLFRKPSSYVNLNKDLYELSIKLAKSVFSVAELEDNGFSSEIQNFINLLYFKQIVTEV